MVLIHFKAKEGILTNKNGYVTYHSMCLMSYSFPILEADIFGVDIFGTVRHYGRKCASLLTPFD